MTRTCSECYARYDDEHRLTICPHNLFAGNDGKNNFAVMDSPLVYPSTFKLENKIPPVLDLSHPHYRCHGCGVSVLETEIIADGEIVRASCLCDGDPAWVHFESAPMAFVGEPLEMPNTSGPSVLMTLAERTALRNDLNRNKGAMLDFIIQLYQRLLYLEKAIDEMTGGAAQTLPQFGDETEPLKLPGSDKPPSLT